MKLSILSLILLPVAVAFVPQLHRPKAFLLKARPDTDDAKSTKADSQSKSDDVARRVKEELEATSPEDLLEDDDDDFFGEDPDSKPDRIFDPSGLWTPHSMNF